IVSHFLKLDYAPNLKHRIPFRYIGDFQFEGEKCVRYDELGDASGFKMDAGLSLPFAVTHTTN
ncbi:MAG: hypothetical protein KJP04_09225, partial [Arenicella sp.]|nr:hypothetical protein [Arenicella sp.]